VSEESPGPDAADGGPGSGESPLPEATFDDLAGVVDLFGALDRAELRRALAELAFKRGESVDDDALADAISQAVAGYYLVPVPADAAEVPPGSRGGERAEGPDDPDAAESSGTDADAGDAPDPLAVGPVAFPSLPPGAEDLPHILDVPERRVDRDALAERAVAQFRADTARAVQAGDADRMTALLDASYDLEAWAAVDVADVRERLDAALDDLDG